MNSIHLQQTLPQVFADRNSVTSDVWHQDLFFRKGEMYLIEAASGTGKSSLCSYIYGYRNDYQGIINFDETNIKAYSVKQWVDLRKHSLSMLFQDLRIFTELSALENVQLKNNLTGCKKKKEILSFFEQLGIADKINVKAGKLSFGQQQRVAFIRALCQPFDFLKSSSMGMCLYQVSAHLRYFFADTCQSPECGDITKSAIFFDSPAPATKSV